MEENDDLLMQVLSRVPGKPLLRFKRVSKRWFFLITHPYFVHLFLRTQYLETNALLLEIPLRGCENREKFVHVVLNLKNKGDNMVKFHESPVGLDFWHHKTNNINGLVCFYRDNSYSRASVFCICNLTTHENLSMPYLGGEATRNNGKAFLGFDPTSKQYKVVYTYVEKDKLEYKVVTVGCKMNSNNCTWRHIDVSHDSQLLITTPIHNDFSRCFCFEGVLYWNAVNRVIVAFNVSHETIECIRYPTELLGEIVVDHKMISVVTVCHVGGYVSLVQLPERERIDSPNIVLWSLKEELVWTKRVITCPSFVSKWPWVSCSDFGLLSKVDHKRSSNVDNTTTTTTDIECYDLRTAQYMVLDNISTDNGLLYHDGLSYDVFKPSLFFENIVSLKDI